MISAVRRHPLLWFFVLAYALSWWPWPLYLLGVAGSPIVSFGPFLAAVVVLASTHGKRGVLGLLRRMVHWRVHPVWYVVALLLPVAISGTAALLNVSLGAQSPSAAELGAWPGLLPQFLLLLLVPGIGGTWEEPGWRGYALPVLQARRSALLASLILAPLWALWHLPLIVYGFILLSDPLFVVAFTVMFTWLFNNTGGSVLIAMLMHAMINTGGFFTAMFSGADSVRQGWLLVALWWAVAIAVVIVTRPEHLSRKYRKQTIA
jgi:membrane protease YdiL (CAAX protease family)